MVRFLIGSVVIFITFFWLSYTFLSNLSMQAFICCAVIGLVILIVFIRYMMNG